MNGHRPGPLTVGTIDYHTGGEAFRIVAGGVPPLQGASVAERRLWAAEHLDHVRQLIVNEPRGHADSYGGFVTPPDDEEGDIGVVFFHNAGFSTACGHGTIALVTWALESGYLPPQRTRGATREVVVDVPSGRLRAHAVVQPDGRVTQVRFVNVPSFVAARDVTVPTSQGDVRCHIAFGGAFYAIVPAADVGLRVRTKDLPRAIELCREVKDALNGGPPIVHPEDDRLRDIYGVILVQELTDDPRGYLVQRNVTVFADGEVDRSATGSGTSARVALLADQGRLANGRVLENRSIVDSVMYGRVLGDAPPVGGIPAVTTEVTGSAFLAGYAQLVLRPDDPIGTGFLLR